MQLGYQDQLLHTLSITIDEQRNGLVHVLLHYNLEILQILFVQGVSASVVTWMIPILEYLEISLDNRAEHEDLIASLEPSSLCWRILHSSFYQQKRR